jgi:hypothetical protein
MQWSACGAMLTTAVQSERLQRSAQGAEHIACHATFIPCNALLCNSARVLHTIVKATVSTCTVLSHAGVEE